MLQLIFLAMLAVKPSTAANINRLQPRMHDQDCCPCPAPGTPGDEGTTVTVTAPAVTVTEPAAAPATETVYLSNGAGAPETVTVEHTVTQQGNTVYVTNGQTEPATQYVTQAPPAESQPAQSEPATQYATQDLPGGSQPPVQSEPATQYVTQEPPTESQAPVETVTVGNESPQPSDEAPCDTTETDNVVTETLAPSEAGEGPTTVTVSIEHAQGKTVTLTAGKPSETAEGPQEVTVTIPYSPPQESSHQGTDNQVVTKTVNGGNGEEYPSTVIVSLDPGTKTVTLDNGHVSTETAKTPEYITVTAAPNAETVSVVKTVDHYKTVTQTVSNDDGGIDIQIIIININTGEQSCKQMNGQPCHGDANSYVTIPAAGATDTPCPSNFLTTPTTAPTTQPTTVACLTDVSTSFSTVYNTVLVTGTGGAKYNATGGMNYALPTGTDGYPIRVRKMRSPFSKFW